MSARALGVAAVAALLAGCVPAYEPPTAQAPQAIVKVRRSYARSYGAAIDERLTIDDHLALAEQDGSSAMEHPRTDWLAVHPGAATFRVSATAWHEELRRHVEWYTCGAGRTVTRCSRVVWERVRVTDAHCDATVRFAPEADAVYLLQFSQLDRSGCSLRCFRQLPAPDDDLALERCEVLPPAK